MSSVGAIKEIYIYPIKSLPGIKLDRCLVTKFGIAHPDNQLIIDRKWMIIDKNGSFQTQRQISKMALIRPSLDGDCIRLSAPGKDDIKVPITPSSTKVQCRVWGLYLPGYVYPSHIGKWISSFLEKPDLNLVTFTEDLENEARQVTQCDPSPACHAKDTDFISYSDASSFMILSDKSLEELNTRLDNPVVIEQFRPNFYVKDCAEAYAEDEWRCFKIGNVQFRMIKHCTRCILTTIDPDTGVRSPNMEPLATLKEYRLEPELYNKSPKFGIHCVLNSDEEQNLSISIGDLVTDV